MKKQITLLSLLVLLSCAVFAASVEKVTLKDAANRDREYFKYVPDSYDGSTSYGILLCLHGFGQTGESLFTDFKIEEMLQGGKFIIVSPTALPEQSQEVKDQLAEYGVPIPVNALWGANINMKIRVYDVMFGDIHIEQWDIVNAVFNKDVDDSALLTQILDDVKKDYNISKKDVFVFGVSMGGFMAYQYALKKSAGLAGIITFNSSMSETMQNRTSGRVNLCDFHSSTDYVVPYTGIMRMTVPPQEEGGDSLKIGNLLGENKTDVINLWVSKNQISAEPEVAVFKNEGDDSPTAIEVTKYFYEPGKPGLEVVHYKAANTEHDHFLSKAKGDPIDYAEEMMAFIGRHTTLTNVSSVDKVESKSISLYPNPATDYVTVEGLRNDALHISIYNIAGQEVKSLSNTQKIDVSDLPSGIYSVLIKADNNNYSKKLIKR